MAAMHSVLHWLLAAAVVDHIVLSRRYGMASGGIPPDALRRFVLATGAALLLLSPASWMLQRGLIAPWQLDHLRLPLAALLALLCAGLGARLARTAEPVSPGDHGLPGLELIAGNALVMEAVLSGSVGNGLLPVLAAGVASAAGFAIALPMLDAIAVRLAWSPVPTPLQGVPALFLAAGLLALGLAAFAAP